jgi:hypothetical protein
MALGGFIGRDPILTADQLAARVHDGDVRFFPAGRSRRRRRAAGWWQIRIWPRQRRQRLGRVKLCGRPSRDVGRWRG